jgi:hypothetical protein
VLFARRSLTAPLVLLLATLTVLSGAVTPVTARAAGPVTNEVLVVAAVRQGGSIGWADGMTRVSDSINGFVHDYWAEQSFGAIEVHATAWPTLVTTAADCGNIQGVYAEVAAQTGWQPGPGKHLVVYGASLGENLPNCSYFDADLGAGRGAGGRSYVRGWDNNSLVQALGRNFGLGYADAQQCVDSILSGQCRTQSRGDGYDPMGDNVNAVGSLSAPQADRLGVLPAAQKVTISATSTTVRTVTLQSLSRRTGVVAIELTDPSLGTTYWLELRTPEARDSWIWSAYPSPLQRGVLVRRTTTSDRAVTLLDPTPTAYAWSGGIHWEENRQVAMPYGEIRLNNTFSVTIVQETLTTASVRISTVVGVYGGDASCAGFLRPTAPMSGVALFGGTEDLTVGGDEDLTAAVVGTDRAVWLRPVDVSSTWRSLGGGALYGPAATTTPTTSYVFVVGTDRALYYRSGSGTTWSPWTYLGGVLTSSPAAAASGEVVRVFGRGGDGSLWGRELYAGVWSPWVAYGGALAGPPTVTVDPLAGFRDAFVVDVRGTDGRLWEQVSDAGSRVGTFTVRQEYACSALGMGDMRTLADAGVGVYLDRYSSLRLLTSMGSRSLGGSLTSTPAVAFDGDQYLAAGRGTDGRLWIYDARVGGYGGWFSLGGGIA